ncbi:MAG TPA: DUF790 family protein [Thermoguttaceae bacterium]|nr:DUF790 family protein [Thermoguttaceae bacterium]
MLTRELAIADYDAGRILPDRLSRKTHGQYVGYAERMLHVYRKGVGRTRRELHRAVGGVFADEEDCPRRRIDAFCKLLDDAATYDRDTRGRAAALRREVFRTATEKHPLVRRADRLFEYEEAQVKAEIAARLGRPWTEIDRELFADVIEFHRLASFEGYPDAAALLARYNVAQVQVALFDAVSMSVWATQDFKTILRYAKLARLMHTIVRSGEDRYSFRFDGPASVLRQTRRYGVAMAKFLPSLVACRDWRMHAVIRTRRRGFHVSLDLSSADGLNSHLPAPEEFDSSVEEAFAEKWGLEKRDGWTLVREAEILHRGQKVFVPDFAFRHDDGRTVLMEIVGFWTSEYLHRKLQTLTLFADHPILLAVTERVQEKMPDLPSDAISFKSVLKIKDVLDRLENGGAA